MASVADSLKTSSINITNISKSLFETKRSVSSVNDSVSNISKIIATNTRIKKEVFANSQIIESRRREAAKRREIEDQLESSRVSTSPSRGLAFAGRSDKGPLGRLVGFLGFITAGWIVENLPTWIFMGQEFITRIQIFGRTMYNMVDNMTAIIQSFGDVLKNTFNAIVTLDFNEFTEGSVAQSFDELNLAVQGLGNEITETFRLFTTPLNESVETGEQAPALDEDRPETMFPSSEGLSPEEQALISTIKKREGTSGSGGYNKFFGGSQYGGDLSQRTVMEVAELQKKFLREGRGKFSGGTSAVVGAGQFKYPEQVVMAMGLDPNKEKFTPELQNKMILFLARKRGIDPTKPLSRKDLEILNKEWSGLGPFYGQNKNTIEGSLKIYQQELKTFKQSSSISTPTPQAPPPPAGKGGKIIEYLTGDRKHKRYRADHAAGNYHDHVAFDSKETRDAAIKWLKGKGWIVGSIDTGKHAVGSFHYSSQAFDIPFYPNQSKKGVTDDSKGETALSSKLRADLIAGGFNGPQLSGSSATPQIASPPSRSAQPAAMTPERKGSQIIFIDDTQPQAPQVSYSSQQSTVTPTITEFKLLNNFIKNKLLLDLAYL